MDVLTSVFLIGGALIILVALIMIGWIIGLYNTFITASQDLKNMWSNIKTEYQRRADLFMNLVESVKGSGKFEKETLKEVIEARSGNFGKTDSAQMNKLKGLDKTFSKMMLVVERYPQLKTTESYKDLMHEIRITEDRINIARTDYNSLVRDYNVLVSTFPNSYFAKMFGKTEATFFESEVGSEKAPKIKLT